MSARSLVHTLLIAAAVLVAGPTTATATNTDAGLAPSDMPAADPFGIYGADEDTALMVHEAMELFQAADLRLPALRIYVHDDNNPCNGNQGLFGKTGDHRRVDICTHHIRLVIHELAHAWEHHNVDDATRQEFMEQADVDVWNDHGVVHQARGVEVAADIIKWGLAEGRIARMSSGHYAEKLAQYELLTGSESPRIAHWSLPEQEVVEIGTHVIRPMEPPLGDSLLLTKYA